MVSLECKECCVNGCRKKAKITISTNEIQEGFSFCKECFEKYDKHCDAREKIFREEGVIKK